MAVVYIESKDKLPKRADHDFYPTPIEFVRAALFTAEIDTPRAVLDVGAGDGVWGKAARERWPEAYIVGVEVRDVLKPDGYDWWFSPCDFLQYEQPSAGWYDMVIGNPPFKFAEPFVRNGLHLLEDDDYLLYLLPLAFLTSEGRANGLFKQHPPLKVVVSAQRISFTGRNNPDLHALYLWRKGYQGETTLDWMTYR